MRSSVISRYHTDRHVCTKVSHHGRNLHGRTCRLWTGQFTLHAGLTANAGEKGLPLGKETIADRMRAGGYQTACVGKWHLGSGSGYTPNSRGFDYFWGFLGGCIDSYSHFYYWGGPNVHDLWENGRGTALPRTTPCISISWTSGRFAAGTGSLSTMPGMSSLTTGLTS